jgi:hypothetical protein
MAMADEDGLSQVDRVPPGAKVRRWTLREDNDAHYHGIVNLSESPLFIELWHRESAVEDPVPVGTFRLDLKKLLDRGFIRRESGGRAGSVRLRIVRASDGVFYVQVNSKGPRARLT